MHWTELTQCSTMCLAVQPCWETTCVRLHPMHTRKLGDVSGWKGILTFLAGRPTANPCLQGNPLCCHRLCCLPAIAIAVATAMDSAACTRSGGALPYSKKVLMARLQKKWLTLCLRSKTRLRTGPSSSPTAMITIQYVPSCVCVCDYAFGSRTGPHCVH